MPGSISIRRSLLVDLVVVIALLGGGLLLTTFVATQRAVQTLSRSIINQSADEVELALGRFFDPVAEGVAVARAWGRNGLLDLHDMPAMNRLFQPVLERTPQVASIYVATDAGDQYQLLRHEGGFRSRLIRPEAWKDRVRVLDWSAAAPEPRDGWIELQYDPRERPWFRGAIAALDARTDAMHWTEPYVFVTEAAPGITASAAWRAGTGARQVVGFDVRLEAITAFTSQERVTPRGQVAVMDEQGRLLGLPADPRFQDRAAWAAALLQTPDRLGIALIDDANRAYRTRVPNDSQDPVRFASGGDIWWAQGRMMPLSAERQLLIAILVPDADVFSDRRAMRAWMLGLTGLVLGVAAIRAVRAARRFSRPLEALAAHSERISRGNLDEAEPVESRIREVQQLTDAQEHMRVGLVSLMKMERDLQVARQIQQSTLPKSLPAIEGFDLVAWGEPADETGGDTYDIVLLGATDDSRGPRALCLLGDATGHGIGPALVATQSRAMLRMAARLNEGIAGIARHLNEQLHADLPGNRYLTAWFGLLDGQAGTLTSFSAGQGPLLHYRAADGSVEALDADTLPLGLLPEVPIVVPPPKTMQRGDIFAVFSDGIFEAVGEDGEEQFGRERVIAILTRHHAARAADILKAVQDAVAAFARGRPADDDRTAWIVKRI